MGTVCCLVLFRCLSSLVAAAHAATARGSAARRSHGGEGEEPDQRGRDAGVHHQPAQEVAQLVSRGHLCGVLRQVEAGANGVRMPLAEEASTARAGKPLRCFWRWMLGLRRSSGRMQDSFVSW